MTLKREHFKKLLLELIALLEYLQLELSNPNGSRIWLNHQLFLLWLILSLKLDPKSLKQLELMPLSRLEGLIILIK